MDYMEKSKLEKEAMSEMIVEDDSDWEEEDYLDND